MLCCAVLSCFNHVRLVATLWTVNCQAPLSMGFSRQEHWNVLPCPPQGIFLTQGSETAAPAAPAFQADSLSLSHQGSPT